MKRFEGTVPDLLPVLSRGKHKSPRSGACFMEFASHLSGEAWSDHPACTHPVLASLARMVNDCTSDDARSRLMTLIPSVIGLRGDDPRVRLVVALRAATAGLPVVSADHQRALAVGILNCQRHLARLSESDSGAVSDQVREAFERAPQTERWAREFMGSVGSWSRTRFTDRTAESIIRITVQGIAEACIPDTDERLFTLLSQAIDDTTRVLGKPEGEPVVMPQPLSPEAARRALRV
ncbi:hypothetical protein [Cryobacterium soli]|jgi:hypothetical protein|uniref:hypothetical protein n=1 Tax=Cryobacterium soli TaxID=2220095 RepID=UPI001FE8F79A|nr:hypothetical protein [Cryobacterium soli]